MLLILKAKVKISPDRLWEPVREEIVRRLLREFDFEKARLGGSILLSDVVAVIQETPGVRYVDIDVFDRMRQFYGPGELVRKAACITGSTGPKPEIVTRTARNVDADVDDLVLDPQGEESIDDRLEAQSFKPTDHHLISRRYPDGTADNRPTNAVLDKRIIATVRIFPGKGLQRPPNAPTNGPAPFPAQLAYFSDLPGTILLEQIP